MTSQLGHPHIIEVFDFGTHRHGQPYLVMEYLEGEDLATSCSASGALPLPPRSASSSRWRRRSPRRTPRASSTAISSPRTSSSCASRARDFVKVLDFGISKVRAASTALTNASTLMGTPMYMAPEQAKGEDELDHRTDQWALACIAYEMLAGRPPFVGDDTAALLYQVVHEEPPPLSQSREDLPLEIEHVIQRALSRSRPSGFPNVTAFARASRGRGGGQDDPHRAGERRGAPSRPGVALTPVEAAATMAERASRFAPAAEAGAARLALWAASRARRSPARRAGARSVAAPAARAAPSPPRRPSRARRSPGAIRHCCCRRPPAADAPRRPRMSRRRLTTTPIRRHQRENQEGGLPSTAGSPGDQREQATAAPPAKIHRPSSVS